MDLAGTVYNRDLKIAAMRALDSGSTTGEVARKFQLSPKLLERWRGEWPAKGEAAFPGIGRRGAELPAVDDARRMAERERKIGQLTMENDFLKKALQRLRVQPPAAVVSGAAAYSKKSAAPPPKGIDRHHNKPRTGECGSKDFCLAVTQRVLSRASPSSRHY